MYLVSSTKNIPHYEQVGLSYVNGHAVKTKILRKKRLSVHFNQVFMIRTKNRMNLCNSFLNVKFVSKFCEDHLMVARFFNVKHINWMNL